MAGHSRARVQLETEAKDGWSRLLHPGIESDLKAELWYQPIGFRWAQNLANHRTAETDRFVGVFETRGSRGAR